MGRADHRPSTAGVNANVLQICRNDFEVVRRSSCGVNQSQELPLSVNGSLFTATNTNTNASDPNSLPAAFTFQVARSGNLSILLAAGTSTRGFVLCTTSTTCPTAGCPTRRKRC